MGGGVIVLLGGDLHVAAVSHLAVATANHPPIALVAVIHHIIMAYHLTLATAGHPDTVVVIVTRLLQMEIKAEAGLDGKFQ